MICAKVVVKYTGELLMNVVCNDATGLAPAKSSWPSVSVLLRLVTAEVLSRLSDSTTVPAWKSASLVHGAEEAVAPTAASVQVALVVNSEIKAIASAAFISIFLVVIGFKKSIPVQYDRQRRIA
ncbi:hypothetical protein EMIT0357P_20340 [Pseudomonas marginalis]